MVVPVAGRSSGAGAGMRRPKARSDTKFSTGASQQVQLRLDLPRAHMKRDRLMRRHGGLTVLLAIALACAGLTVLSTSAPPALATGRVLAASGIWDTTWNASQAQADPSGGQSQTGFANQSVRQIVHVSVGGSSVRVQLSGLFDSRNVTVTAGQVGISQAGSGVVAGTNRALTVGGGSSFVLPAGGTVLSDPINLPVAPGALLAISLYFQAPTGPTTWHPLAVTTNYIAPGNQVANPGAMAGATTTTSWYFLSGIQVNAPTTADAVVAFGASTTDGQGSTLDADRRWPDDLYRRIQQQGQGGVEGVANAGISGNRLLTDGGISGQSGLSRFSRDALSTPGAKVVIVSSLGNNDIGFNQGPDGGPVTAAEIIAGYQRLITEAHTAGLTIIGGTITPDQGSFYYSAAGEAKRQAVNNWILTSGAFDATIDFATAVADPNNRSALLPAYDTGDHLHLNDSGYQAMANAVNLSALTPTFDPIAAHYNALGGASSFLGAPTGPEEPVGNGQMQTFQGGTIYFSPSTGAFEVHGSILGHYQVLGGPTGVLGFPTSDELATQGAGGRFNTFQNSGDVIDWSPATGAFEVGGAIQAHYYSLGGTASFLGFPTSDEEATQGPGGRFNTFQNGGDVIDWSPATGAFEVGGAIQAHYRSLGGTASFLGFPTSDELPTRGPGGRFNSFQNNGDVIDWSPATGAFEVGGAIQAHYYSMGGTASFLGFPTSDELATRGAGGRFNSFQNNGDVIDWSPATGAFEVGGAIQARYSSLGGTSSFLGFPISDEFQVGPAGRQSNFQRGYIFFNFTNGVITVG